MQVAARVCPCQQGTMNEHIRRTRLPETIVRDDYTPATLSLVANSFMYGASEVFFRLFGIRTNEWRVLSALANVPGSTATDTAEVLGLNKSVISRSLSVLVGRGLVVVEREPGAKRLYLTGSGAELH